jgi:transcriptional regulator with XRE-family HTH domain
MAKLDESYASVLRTRRERMGLTQQQVADFLGMAQPTLSDLENGVHVPTLTTFLRWHWALGLELHWKGL